MVDPTLFIILAIATGLNSGILLCMLVWLLVIFGPRRRKARQAEAEAPPEMPPARRPEMQVGVAIMNLVGAINAMHPDWESIEVDNVGDGQISMQITRAGGEKIDPSKRH